jgi:hypothetical protein
MKQELEAFFNNFINFWKGQVISVNFGIKIKYTSVTNEMIDFYSYQIEDCQFFKDVFRCKKIDSMMVQLRDSNIHWFRELRGLLTKNLEFNISSIRDQSDTNNLIVRATPVSW